jgi:hypothetical protein
MIFRKSKSSTGIKMDELGKYVHGLAIVKRFHTVVLQTVTQNIKHGLFSATAVPNVSFLSLNTVSSELRSISEQKHM